LFVQPKSTTQEKSVGVSASGSPRRWASRHLGSCAHIVLSATKHAEPSIDEVATRKEPERGSAPHPQLTEVAKDLFIGWIDHQSPTQVANPFRLESKRQVYAGQVPIQRGVEELLSRCRPAQFQGLIEAPLANGETQAVERSIPGTCGLQALRGVKVLERRVIAVVIHCDHSPVEVLVGGGTRIHRGAPLPSHSFMAGRIELPIAPTPAPLPMQVPCRK
jgi:hypothetical protein